MVAGMPPQCLPALEAAHCWRWCGGWRPDLWPAYDALHAVEDWQMTLELMQTIRENV